MCNRFIYACTKTQKRQVRRASLLTRGGRAWQDVLARVHSPTEVVAGRQHLPEGRQHQEEKNECLVKFGRVLDAGAPPPIQRKRTQPSHLHEQQVVNLGRGGHRCRVQRLRRLFGCGHGGVRRGGVRLHEDVRAVMQPLDRAAELLRAQQGTSTGPCEGSRVSDKRKKSA